MPKCSIYPLGILRLRFSSVNFPIQPANVDLKLPLKSFKHNFLNAWKLEGLGGGGAAPGGRDYGDEDAPSGVGDPPDDFSEPAEDDIIPF